MKATLLTTGDDHFAIDHRDLVVIAFKAHGHRRAIDRNVGYRASRQGRDWRIVPEFLDHRPGDIFARGVNSEIINRDCVLEALDIQRIGSGFGMGDIAAFCPDRTVDIT